MLICNGVGTVQRDKNQTRPLIQRTLGSPSRSGSLHESWGWKIRPPRVSWSITIKSF